jgi:cysteinyl-tRNA synthetase
VRRSSPQYIPQVIEFIEGIIRRGFAYESNGSVYFDVPAYSCPGSGHAYGKLVPENVGNTAAAEEGEGALSTSVGLADKRNSNDFALWKRSKPGEPSWDSPWGPGRPGWHIECSAMCGDALQAFSGGPIDIHSGGIDLRFPHHDNEIAQSEAFFGCKQWTNYFMHAGHLHIDNQKMSKSLKNFIKISQALERFPARQLRLLFLASRYNAPMDYSVDAMESIAAMDRKFSEFFANVRAALRDRPMTGPQKWLEAEKQLAAAIADCKERVRLALEDDFDTPAALTHLLELVKEVNKYLRKGTVEGYTLIPLVIKSAAEYVLRMLKIFGLVDPHPSLGYSMESRESEEGAGLEARVGPFLDAIAGFRDTVRASAKAQDFKGVLIACDQLRDDVMPEVGVRLEDVNVTVADSGAGKPTTVQKSVWKLADAEELRRERQARVLAEQEKRERKEREAEERRKKEEEKRRKEAERAERAKIPPRELFQQAEYAGKFS